MVLSMEVGFPQEPPDDPDGLDSASAQQLVGSHVTVGVFGVTEEVNGSIAEDARNDPPEEQVLKALRSVAKSRKDDNVNSHLKERPELQVPNDG